MIHSCVPVLDKYQGRLFINNFRMKQSVSRRTVPILPLFYLALVISTLNPHPYRPLPVPLIRSFVY